LALLDCCVGAGAALPTGEVTPERMVSMEGRAEDVGVVEEGTRRRVSRGEAIVDIVVWLEDDRVRDGT
jgi:hypothetical protein